MNGHIGDPRQPDGRAGRADHRLALYRTPDGDLMCLARAGALSSETPVSVAFCGTEFGCQGMWRCLDGMNTCILKN